MSDSTAPLEDRPHASGAPSSWRRRPRRQVLITSLSLAALVCGLVSAPAFGPASAAEYDPGDFPSWSDVETAKSSEAATAAEVETITAALAGLQGEAARLGDLAVQKASESALADQALAQAADKVAALEARTTTAQSDADTAKRQAGLIAAQLYRSGAGDISTNLLISDSQETSQLLYRLGTMTQITQQATALRESAETKQNLASSLAAQARTAEDERASLADAAESALDAANDASSQADALVAETQTRSDVLYAQLASLKNTTAEVEKEYSDGQAAKAAYEQQLAEAEERARREAEANNGSGGGVSVAAPVAPPVTGSGMSPAQAQAYASSVLGNYGWGGDQYGCLVSLWNGESNWRYTATNPSSGAYGIPQAWPASKLATAGADWRTNAATQVNWGLSYIKSSYGSPCNAWSKWQARSPHWY